jgi:hypothetical protein
MCRWFKRCADFRYANELHLGIHLKSAHHFFSSATHTSEICTFAYLHIRHPVHPGAGWHRVEQGGTGWHNPEHVAQSLSQTADLFDFIGSADFKKAKPRAMSIKEVIKKACHR